MPPALEASQLWKLYQAGESTVEAVRGVNVRIEAGEMIAVMGPSGCGKTTLLNILSGIDDIQQILDDQIVKVQAMAGSRYIKPIIGRLKKWEHMLVNLQDIIDECLKVQATWLLSLIHI